MHIDLHLGWKPEGASGLEISVKESCAQIVCQMDAKDGSFFLTNTDQLWAIVLFEMLWVDKIIIAMIMLHNMFHKISFRLVLFAILSKTTRCKTQPLVSQHDIFGPVNFFKWLLLLWDISQLCLKISGKRYGEGVEEKNP